MLTRQWNNGGRRFGFLPDLVRAYFGFLKTMSLLNQIGKGMKRYTANDGKRIRDWVYVTEESYL